MTPGRGHLRTAAPAPPGRAAERAGPRIPRAGSEPRLALSSALSAARPGEQPVPPSAAGRRPGVPARWTAPKEGRTPHRRSAGRRTSHPINGNRLAMAKAAGQESRPTSAPNRGEATATATGEDRVLKAEGRSDAGRARHLCGGGEGHAVPRHREHARDDQRDRGEGVRAVQEGGRDREGHAGRQGDGAQRPDAAAEAVRPDAGHDAGDGAAELDRRQGEGGRADRPATLLVEVRAR